MIIVYSKNVLHIQEVKSKEVFKERLCDNLPHDLQVNTNRIQSDKKV